MNTSSIAERFKGFRKEFNLSQEEIADSLGLKKGAISQVENGGSLPRAKGLIKLHELYNLNIQWLLTGEGDMLVGNSNITMSESSVKGPVIQGKGNKFKARDIKTSSVGGNIYKIGKVGSGAIEEDSAEYDKIVNENIALREELAKVKGELEATEKMLERMFNKKQ